MRTNCPLGSSRRAGALLYALVCLAPPALGHAQATLITGLGGPADFGTNVMAVGDDNSSPAIDLAAYDLNGLCFFGAPHSTLFINNNGNITLNASTGGYTPDPFPASNNPMIAPWWGDVDTRGGVGAPAGANHVYWDIRQVGGLGQLVVTWFDVGYYGAHTDKLNTFQLVIRETAASTPSSPADYIIELRYAQLQWTTGDASGGSAGLGGTPSQAGFDAGDDLHYLALPGSRTASVLNLLTTSNVGDPGVWRFNFHSCQLSCNSAADCDGPTPTCDATTRTCRPCAADADCSAPTDRCALTGPNTGRCVQCNMPTDCATGICSANNACVCASNANCSPGTPICDLGTLSCRPCNPSVGSDCTGATPVCGPVGDCVQCGPGLTAACAPPNTLCNNSGTCVQCLPSASSTCTGATPICDDATFSCRGCTAATEAADCSPAAPYCQTVGTGAGGCVVATATISTPDDGSTTLEMQPSVTGTAPPGSTVIITIDGSDVGTATADTTGNYSFTPPSALSVGSHSVTATVQLTAGTGPTSAPSTFLVAQCLGDADCALSTMLCDTTAHLCRGCLSNANCSGSAPACDAATFTCRGCSAATVGTDCTDPTAQACISDGPMAGACAAAVATLVTPADGASIADATPNVTGTAPAGTSVVIYVDDVEVGRATADASGNYSFDVPAVTLGGHTVSAAVAVGASTGAMSASHTFTLVECVSSGDCAVGVCDPAANVCRGCLGSSDCSAPTAVCDPTTFVCRGCTGDGECSGATPACDVPSGVCVACTASSHTNCVASGDGSACLSDNVCGCNSGSDCSSDRMCDPASSRCVTAIPIPDGGTVVPDGGTVVPDGGTVLPDGGTLVPDGGTVSHDGGGTVSDGGLTDDGGGGGITGGGCGCRVPGSAGESPAHTVWMGLVMAIGAIVVSRRRRR